MPKITFLGAGSTVFAKNVLGDALLSPALREGEFALYDIDATRLRESQQMLETLNKNINKGRARITTHHGTRQRKAALRGADYVINAIQVGGYKPSTVIDFEIPKRYGLRQTIADTLGIGGLFRALRTIPVMMDFARDMEAVCPDAWMLNYTNPMATLSGAMLRGTNIRYVGLCHSVQVCADGLMEMAGLDGKAYEKYRWQIAGINHMAWLLEIADGGTDLYPEIKKCIQASLKRLRKAGTAKVRKALQEKVDAGKRLTKAESRDRMILNDMVRLEMMLRFGYYITESSEHNAEYSPFWIKSNAPELLEEYGIPLDEYPRRCVKQIEDWKRNSKEMVGNPKLNHKRSHEYASFIMEAMETHVPYRIGGNVLNAGGLISNLPQDAVVEVPCLVDRNGIQPCHVGALPEGCAAMNRTNINTQLLTVDAALTGCRDALYQAAYMDPHTAAELPLDAIRSLCDDLIEAHGSMLPAFQ